MEFPAYIEAAVRTAPRDLGPADMLVDVALGLCGEAGEIRGADPADLDDELGDGWWYVAVGFRVLEAAPRRPHRPSEGPGAGDRKLFPPAAAIAERAKKIRFHGDAFSEHRSSLLDRLREYAAALSAWTETPDAEIWRMNIEKLQARYPEGFRKESE